VSRNLIDILDLGGGALYASTLAWLLDPRGEHGLGPRLLLDLGRHLADVGLPGLATAAERPNGLDAVGTEVRLGDGHPRVVVALDGRPQYALLVLPDAPGPLDVEDLVAEGLTPVAVAREPDALGDVEAPTWGLDALRLALEGLAPRDAYGHYLEAFREHLRAELAEPGAGPGLLPGAAAPPPAAQPPVGAPGGPAPTGRFARPTGRFARTGRHARPGQPRQTEPVSRVTRRTSRRREAEHTPDEVATDRKSVSTVLEALQRAVRYYRLYPHDHPFCVEAVDEAHGLLTAFLDRHGALSVRIDRDGALFAGERVLHDSGNAADLSYLLFPDGVRNLTFETGLEKREVQQFAETLSGQELEAGVGPADGDLLAALWRREFSHVHYMAFDPLAPASLQRLRDPAFESIGARITGLVAAVGRVEPERDDALVAARETLEPPADPARSGAVPEAAARFLATPPGAARRELLAPRGDPFLGDDLGRAADAVAWALGEEEQAAETVHVTRFLVGTVANALWNEDLERAADLLARAEAGGDAIVGAVSAELASRHSLALLSRILHRPEDREAAVRLGMRYLSHLGAAAVAGICRFYGTIVEPRVREVFRAFLAHHVGQEAETIGQLALHADERIAREAIDLLEGAGRESPAFAALERCAADPEHPQRAGLAREAVGRLTGEVEREQCLATIARGADREERVAAAARLREIGTPRAFERLGEIVQQRDFGGRDEAEIDAVLETLTGLGGLRSVRVLQELTRRTGLLRRRETERLSTAASSWLESLRRRDA